jgi:hypothetical protein
MNIDDPNISNVVFYPRRGQKPERLPEEIKILEFAITNKISLGGFFFANNSKYPTILLFHGNGEISHDYANFYDLFFKCGVNLAVMDFRGYGFSSGEPTYSSLIDDAMPVYNNLKIWLQENNFRKSIFIQGRSLGSVCASEIGSHNPINVKGIIFESGFASVYNMMTRLFRVEDPSITEESLKEFSNDTRIVQFKKPTLIIHGTNDWIIPKEESKQIFKTLPDEVDKELVLIEGAGHNDIFSFQQEYFNPLRKFIKKNRKIED